MDFSTKYLAPNGQPSNLTPEQSLLVRSPQFKAWFGDWENDPENASKVVDENGEPLVMYSGSPNKFTVFESQEVDVDRDDREYKPRFWFIRDREWAENYSRKATGFVESIYECFLNIRKPKFEFNLYVNDNNDGAIEYRSRRSVWVAIATTSNQIKLADGTNTTFDGTNPDIRFEDGGTFESKQKQLEIINRSNPSPNEYNTWIRKVDDIKTAEQVFSIAFEDGAMYPDFQTDDMTKALDSGYVTVFSSYPIKEGVFVTPSKMNALDYAGGKGGKVFSKTVELKDIAWIDESEGQYAPTELFAKGGTTEYLLAPNGQQSNLTPEQWRLVRSPEFKRWFGDWENDPENASKVVDENGEPMAVIHGTPNEFNVFRENSLIYTSDNESYQKELYPDKSVRLIKLFGNSKKVLDLTQFGQFPKDLEVFNLFLEKTIGTSVPRFRAIYAYFRFNDITIDALKKAGYDAIRLVFEQRIDQMNIALPKKQYKGYIFLESNQIKLADGTNTTFDGANPDIRFANGGGIDDLTVGHDYSGKEVRQTVSNYDSQEGTDMKAFAVENIKLKEKYLLDYVSVQRLIENDSSLHSYISEEYDPNVEVEYQPIEKPILLGNDPWDNTENVVRDGYHRVLQALYNNEDEILAFIPWSSKTEVRFSKGGKTKLLAPNGQPSNLTPEQWRLVRTSEFKRWFGDWENSPETSSKVIDENGEPLVVYHFTDKKFNIFDIKKAQRGLGGKGFYFTDDANAQDWGVRKYYGESKKEIEVFSYAVFLNIKNLKIGFGMYDENTYNFDNGSLAIFEIGKKKEKTFVVFQPNQIKLADGTNTTFNGANPDIRFAKGGTTEYLLAPNGQPSNLTPEQWRLVRTPEFKAWFGDWEKAYKTQNYDGVSKVVDTETSEPMVVYHGTNNKFNEFTYQSAKKSASGLEPILGFYFSVKKQTKNNSYGKYISSFFLNIKNNLYVDYAGNAESLPKNKLIKLIGKRKVISDFYLKDGKEWIITKVTKEYYRNGENRTMSPQNQLHWIWEAYYSNDKTIEEFQKEVTKIFGLDGFYMETLGNENFIAFHPEQIKLADGTNTTFDGANPDIRFKKGGRTISQTPSPTKDRIYGSQVNPKKSSSNLSSALKIEFSAETTKTIKDKVEKHNAEYPNKQITVESAKAVVRRGMGAYSKSHRPTISGGKPNSRVAWGLARLNAFIYKILNGKSKSGKYKQDDDLISELGYKVSRFDNGGKTDIPTRFFGSQAGGVLIYCKTTNRVLLLLRSPFVLEPFTWGTVSGKVEGDEQIEETVRREAYEETGYELKTLYPSYVFERPNFKFFNFISIVEQEFEPQLDWENIDYLWTSLDNLPENLHFGLVELLKHGKIEETVKQITARFKKRG